MFILVAGGGVSDMCINLYGMGTQYVRNNPRQTIVNSKFPQPSHVSSRNATSHLLCPKSKPECADSKSCSILKKTPPIWVLPSRMISQLQVLCPFRTGLLSWIEKPLLYTYLLCLCKLVSHLSIVKRTGASRTGKSCSSGSCTKLSDSLVTVLSTSLLQKKRKLKPSPSFLLSFLLPLLLQNILGSVCHQDLLQAVSRCVV